MQLAEWPTPPVSLQILIIALLGLVFGSFTTAISHRAARNEGWVGGRSHCPFCNATLRFFDLIPLFSWLFLRGRCRHCGASISWRYPIIELALVIACLGVYAVYGFTPAALIAMAALPFLIALVLIDLETFILPDGLQIILSVLGFPFIVFTAVKIEASLLSHLTAAALFSFLVWLTGKTVSFARKKQALGFGDVKFFAVAGWWLGLASLPIFLITSGVAGVVFGLCWRATHQKGQFPFGPALVIAFYTCLLLQGWRFFNPTGL